MQPQMNSWQHRFTGLIVFGSVFMGLSVPAAFGQERGPGIAIPKFSETAKQGQTAFSRTCAQCHGRLALGTDKGPPLIHPIYNPGHHGDAAFYRAVRQGSPQHHWRFGDMPPQPNVTAQEVSTIIRYIRELQEANGIVYRRHRM